VRFKQTSSWNSMHWWSGPGLNLEESPRLWVRQLKRPDGRKCWAGSEELRAVDGWRNTGAAECRHRRPERSSPTGTAVRWHGWFTLTLSRSSLKAKMKVVVQSLGHKRGKCYCSGRSLPPRFFSCTSVLRTQLQLFFMQLKHVL